MFPLKIDLNVDNLMRLGVHEDVSILPAPQAAASAHPRGSGLRGPEFGRYSTVVITQPQACERPGLEYALEWELAGW